MRKKMWYNVYRVRESLLNSGVGNRKGGNVSGPIFLFQRRHHDSRLFTCCSHDFFLFACLFRGQVIDRRSAYDHVIFSRFSYDPPFTPSLCCGYFWKFSDSSLLVSTRDDQCHFYLRAEHYAQFSISSKCLENWLFFGEKLSYCCNRLSQNARHWSRSLRRPLCRLSGPSRLYADSCFGLFRVRRDLLCIAPSPRPSVHFLAIKKGGLSPAPYLLKDAPVLVVHSTVIFICRVFDGSFGSLL